MGVKLLLDTHALIWAFNDASQFGSHVLNLIKDADNAVFASNASVWELAIKHQSGRLPEAKKILRDYQANLAKMQFLELLISSDHAIEAGSLNWTHRDPFDRMLVAQAKLENATIVTKDENIRALGLVKVLW